MFGICTNFPYVVMLSSAYDILDNLTNIDNDPDEIVSTSSWYELNYFHAICLYSIILRVPFYSMKQLIPQIMLHETVLHMEHT